MENELRALHRSLVSDSWRMDMLLLQSGHPTTLFMSHARLSIFILAPLSTVPPPISSSLFLFSWAQSTSGQHITYHCYRPSQHVTKAHVRPSTREAVCLELKYNASVTSVFAQKSSSLYECYPYTLPNACLNTYNPHVLIHDAMFFCVIGPRPAAVGLSRTSSSVAKFIAASVDKKPL